MSGHPITTDNHQTAGSAVPENDAHRTPSTLGGWARAIGWGSLTVAGCGAILLLSVPGGSVGADTVPCEQVRDQAGCQLLEPAATGRAVPTVISTPGQVPFARSPTP